MKSIYRKNLSFNSPGLSSLYFQQVLDIVNTEIVGWDFGKGHAVEAGGLFGVPKAVFNTIEEQGRNRLHVHIGI